MDVMTNNATMPINQCLLPRIRTINTTVKNERDNWFTFVLKLSFSSSGSLHSMPLFNNKKILSLLANRENIFSLTLRKSKNIDS